MKEGSARDAKPKVSAATDTKGAGPNSTLDPLYNEAVRFVRERGQASTTMLQRKFEIGYVRASEMVDAMEARGVISARDGFKPRQVLEDKISVSISFAGGETVSFEGVDLDHVKQTLRDQELQMYGRPRDDEDLTDVTKPRNDLPLIPGKFLKAILARFTRKPDKDGGGSHWPECSIGIGDRSVAATDKSGAIRIGRYELSHDATVREEAFIEAERAIQYNVSADVSAIAKRMEEGDTGVVVPFVPITPILERVNGMQSLTTVDPELLKSAALLACAAGTRQVELLIDPKDRKMLGFRFEYLPELQTSLFDDADKVYRPVPVEGVLIAKPKKGDGHPDSDLEDEEE